MYRDIYFTITQAHQLKFPWRVHAPGLYSELGGLYWVSSLFFIQTRKSYMKVLECEPYTSLYVIYVNIMTMLKSIIKWLCKSQSPLIAKTLRIPLGYLKTNLPILKILGQYPPPTETPTNAHS